MLQALLRSPRSKDLNRITTLFCAIIVKRHQEGEEEFAVAALLHGAECTV